MAVEETSPHGLKKYTAGTDPIPGRVGHNQMIDLMNQIPGLGIGPLSSRPAPSAGLRFWVEESTNRLSVNIGTSWAGIAEVGAVIPSQILVGSEGVEGSSSRSARADHAHELPLASLLGPGAMSAEFFALLAAATWQSIGDTLVRRTAAGNVHAQTLVVEGSQSTDSKAATRKDYVDNKTWSAASINKDVMDPARLPLASPVANGVMSAADKAKLNVIPTIGAWIPIPLYGDHTASAYTPQYRTNSGRVELRGAVTKGTGNQVFTNSLPLALRPKENFGIPLAYSASIAQPWDSGNVIHGAVTTFGSVSIGRSGEATTIPIGSHIYLDGISWAIEG